MVLRRMLDSNAIDRLFSEHADEQHHRSLLFSDLAVLVSGVVLGKHRSMNAGYKKMKEQLGVSVTAVSEKLQRVELPVVQQLVRHSYQQTVEIYKAVGSVAHNDLSGDSTRIRDGNWLAGTEHRLTETRTSAAAPLPGQSLVVYDPKFNAVSGFGAQPNALGKKISDLKS